MRLDLAEMNPLYSLSRQWIAALFVFVLSGTFVAAQSEPNPTANEVQIGWNGHLVLGFWTNVHARVEISEAATYRIDVTATDPDGNLATFQGTESQLAPGTHQIAGRFQLGREDGLIQIQVFKDGGLWKDLTPQVKRNECLPHRSSEQLLITVGLPKEVQALFPGNSFGQRTVLHLQDVSQLSGESGAYDGVSGLLLAGKQTPEEFQATAIEQWVRSGGRLFISLGTSPGDFRQTPLAKKLPLEVAVESISIRELTSLESYTGKTVRIVPPGQRVMIPKFSYPTGKSLAGSRTDPVLVRVPMSFGTVTILGMDATQAPLKNWPGLSELLLRMTDLSTSTSQLATRSQQFGSTGVSDMASQISGAMEDFEGVSRSSPWWVMGGLVVVLALIGPLDYWIVDRLWKRPMVTWLSFPILLAICAVFAIQAAGRTNGNQLMVNQLAVVDVDGESHFVRGHHWTTLYSPESRRFDLECQPAWAKWMDAKAGMEVGWSGLPESIFGGMYGTKSTSLQIGQAQYRISPAEGRYTQIPAAQWSTIALASTSQGTHSGMVESKLVSNAIGRLSGTITHRLPAPLTDWFLVFENRIYRQLKRGESDDVVPLEPQRVFRVDQPAVSQRELRGYLTRTTARNVHRSNSTSGSDQLVVQQANYDPLSRDLTRILPLLSFHASIDGETYTGLQNETLEQLDLSSLVQLDRAILLGYLEEQVSELELKSDSQTTPGSRRTTFVRMVLPVDRNKQMIPELPKLEKVNP